MLKAKVHPANVFDLNGIKLLLEGTRERFSRISHLWMDGGYNGRGKGEDRVEKELGLTAQSSDVLRVPATCGSRKARRSTGRESVSS